MDIGVHPAIAELTYIAVETLAGNDPRAHLMDHIVHAYFAFNIGLYDGSG